MMSNILERLRSNIVAPTLLSDAAKEIESLRQQLDTVTKERDEAKKELKEIQKFVDFLGLAFVDDEPTQDSGEDK